MALELVLKSQPTPGDRHVNGPLTNMSVAFMQADTNFVADRAFPSIPSQKQGDVFFTYDRGFANRDSLEVRAPNSPSAELGYAVSTDSFFCNVWAGHVPIADQSRANEDAPLNADQDAATILSTGVMINREVNWASSFFTTSVWTTDLTGVSGAPGAGEFRVWSDYAASSPISDIELGKQTVGASTGFEPNRLVIGRATWGYLKEHPEIVDRLNRGQTTGPAVATLDSVAAILELDEILVSRAIKNTAKEGAANTHSYILGDNALLCYVPPSPGLRTPAAGYTMTWNGYVGAARNGVRVRRFRMEELSSDRAEIESAYVQKKISADLGYFFSNTVA